MCKKFHGVLMYIFCFGAFIWTMLILSMFCNMKLVCLFTIFIQNTYQLNVIHLNAFKLTEETRWSQAVFTKEDLYLTTLSS